MTYTKPQPGPTKFSVTFNIEDGTQETHELYAFFAFDKDPDGTEFWEVNQIVTTQGEIVPHPSDYGVRGYGDDYSLLECQQVWEVMQQTFYPD